MNLSEIIAAEQALLGSIVMDPENIDRIGDSITSSDFTGPGHAKAWDGLLDLRATGGPVGDVGQVIGLLRRLGVFELVGGVSGVGEWTRAVPSSGLFYAKEVRKASQMRLLDKLATEVRMRVDQREDPVKLAAWLSCQLDGINGDQGFGLQTIGQAAQEALTEIRAALAKGVTNGANTGLEDIDDVTGGLFGGDMVVVAARPSVGKSALAVQIGIHAAANVGPVLLVSLEMRGKDLALRQFAKHTGLTVSQMRAARLQASDVSELADAVDELNSTDVTLLASRNVNTTRIRAAARLQKASGGLSMVIIDYLGLVKPVDHKPPRYEQVAAISAALKDLAMELDVPVIVLCQLNRDADKEKPKLSHLRDSGAIEQDADVVWLLHRETKSSETAELEIAKNRQGATGSITLQFDPGTTTFRSREARDMPNYEDEFAGYGGPAF